MSDFPRKLSVALLLALLGVCLYRARVQSFTVDEAWVVESYVNKPLSEMTHHYDACNHVLHTLLMKASRELFGMGELGLRLPSLIGAALYFSAAYRLATLLFGGWSVLLAVAALSMNPLLLDFMVAARGYGLGLALLLWAAYCAVCWLIRGRAQRWLWRAGILAGASVAAHLTMLVPVAAIGIALLAIAARDGKSAAWQTVDSYGGPAMTVAFLAIVLVMLPATKEDFYFGVPNFGRSVETLVEAVAKNYGSSFWHYYALVMPALSRVVLPGLFWLLSAGAVLVLYRGWRNVEPMSGRAVDSVDARYYRQNISFRHTPFVLAAGALAMSVLLLVAAHYLAGVLYPVTRTGLYLIPLFTLALLLACKALGESGWRKLRNSGHLLLGLLVFFYATLNDNRYFNSWRFDASTLAIIRYMGHDYAAGKPERPARLAASAVFVNSVRFYHNKRKITWLQPDLITKDLESAQADYYLLTNSDMELVDKLKLRVVYQDGVADCVLARPTG